MSSFTLDRSEFGINRGKSWLEVVTAHDGPRTLSFEIHADESLFNSLSGEDDSPWSWALYPPFLYLVELPIPDFRDAIDRVVPADVPEVETALYMMEHNTVTEMRVMLSVGELRVSGRAHILGQTHALQIVYPR